VGTGALQPHQVRKEIRFHLLRHLTAVRPQGDLADAQFCSIMISPTLIL